METKISELMDYIQDDAVELQIKNIASSEKIKEATMKKLHSNTDAPKGTRKAPRMLLIAALIVMALTATAFATGLAQSVFGAMKDAYAVSDAARDEKYLAADKLSDKEVRTKVIPEFGGTTLSVTQSYYDGESLMLGLSFDVIRAPADFDFDRNSAYFELLEPINTGTTSLDLDPKDNLSDEEYAEFNRLYEQNGCVGVSFDDIYIRDHMTLPGGEDVGAYNTLDTPNGTLLEFQWLEDSAKDLDDLTLCMGVCRTRIYYYLDSTGAYYHMDFANKTIETVTVHVPRSK
ncbi:MAG: hypothetical protein RR731_03600 [Oscillospiraceae bacterium]